MAVGDSYVFPGFLSPVLTQLFFPKPPTTILTCFCRGERRKYAGKKNRLNRGSNSQPPGHESDTLTTEPPGQDRKDCRKRRKGWLSADFSFSYNIFKRVFNSCESDIRHYQDLGDRIFNRVISEISFVQSENTLNTSDFIKTPVKSKIVRVVSLSTTEIT